MAGTAAIGGSVWPFSQLRTVQGFTPSWEAASRWLSFNSSRCRLTCSPKVLGMKAVSFGFRHLSVTGTHGKKATRPCPCGYLGHPGGRCRCTPDQVIRYRGKISGPLLDRIDIQIEVPDVPSEDLTRASCGERSSVIRERVEKARAGMLARQGKENARLSTREIDKYCAPDEQGAMLIKQAIGRLGLSARGYHRVLKVARTIADLADSVELSSQHLGEAIQYRRFDRGV